MAKDKASESVFRAEFINRTKEARVQAGLTQQEMADILKTDQGTYKQYETRSVLPHRHVAAFCAATHVSASWLFTGRARKLAAE